MLCALPCAQVGRLGTHEQKAMKDIVVSSVLYTLLVVTEISIELLHDL